MKTILVTGASAGFGTAFARRFIKDGYKVIATDRRMEQLLTLKNELGESLLPMQLDMMDKAAIAQFVKTLPEPWRQIDVVVNNAGRALGLSPAWEADTGEWDTMVATNVTGLVHITHAILPQMVERNDGIILNIGSVAGEYPHPGAPVYGATNAFVRQFSLNLRQDLANTSVRVTDLEPAFTDGSEFSQVRFGGDQAKAASVYDGTRPLRPEDIAEVASWIISLPDLVNVNRIELMPTSQANAPLTVKKNYPLGAPFNHYSAEIT